ncbi:MAG: flagellar hook-basal body protein [Firmicutes bacterium]|nr:flagellar hook-basal body protein [Bacillota bacterium]
MQKGFYDLTSGMLTQNRILNNVSDNLTNISTPGYKRDELVTTTFHEQMQIRTGNTDKSNRTDLADASMLRTVDEVYTNFEQGFCNDTNRSLDFAVQGDAFFEIRGRDGNTYYTRNGSFTLDNDGNLQLQNIGLVIGDDDNPINLMTDKITCDSAGNITDLNGNPLGTIKLVTFNDTDQLLKTAEGMFTNPDAGNIAEEGDSIIKWKHLESSNTELTDVITDMITAQRAFQSASQLLRMYDEVLNQTVTEISRIG